MSNTAAGNCTDSVRPLESPIHNVRLIRWSSGSDPAQDIFSRNAVGSGWRTAEDSTHYLVFDFGVEAPRLTTIHLTGLEVLPKSAGNGIGFLKRPSKARSVTSVQLTWQTFVPRITQPYENPSGTPNYSPTRYNEAKTPSRNMTNSLRAMWSRRDDNGATDDSSMDADVMHAAGQNSPPRLGPLGPGGEGRRGTTDESSAQQRISGDSGGPSAAGTAEEDSGRRSKGEGLWLTTAEMTLGVPPHDFLIDSKSWRELDCKTFRRYIRLLISVPNLALKLRKVEFRSETSELHGIDFGNVSVPYATVQQVIYNARLSMLKNVPYLPRQGTPGTVSVFGSCAFPLFFEEFEDQECSGVGDERQVAFNKRSRAVAAASYAVTAYELGGDKLPRSGRVVAFAHNNYVGQFLKHGDKYVSSPPNDAHPSEAEARLCLKNAFRNAVLWSLGLVFLNTWNQTTAFDPSTAVQDANVSVQSRTGKLASRIRVGFIGVDTRQAKEILLALNFRDADIEVAVGVKKCTADNLQLLADSNLMSIIWTNSDPQVETCNFSEIRHTPEASADISPQDAHLMARAKVARPGWWAAPKDRATVATDPRVELILNFLTKGGGLVVGVCPWGWEQLSGGMDVRDRSIFNHVLRRVGLLLQPTYAAAGDRFYPHTVQVLPSEPGPRVDLRIPGGFASTLRHFALAKRPITRRDLLALVPLIVQLPFEAILPLVAAYCPSIAMMRHVPDALAMKAGRSIESSKDSSINVVLIDQSTQLREIMNVFWMANVKTPSSAEEKDESFFPIEAHAFDGDTEVHKIEDQHSSFDKMLRIMFMQHLWNRLPNDQISAAAGISQSKVPGAIDVSTAPRVATDVWLKSNAEGWQSTGLYALPGVPFEVTLIGVSPPSGSWQRQLSWDVQLGCHTDRLCLHDLKMIHSMKRWPSVTVRKNRCEFALPPSHTSDTGAAVDVQHSSRKAADSGSANEGRPPASFVSPFGGLVYFEAQTAADEDEHSTEQSTGGFDICFRVVGCTKALYWEKRRDVEESSCEAQSWATARDAEYAAPWGEIEGRNVIFSLPIDTLKKVENIEEVIQLWDEVLDHYLELSAQSLARKERVVCDVQIAAGYMHSGYPIMTHMDVAEIPEELPHIVNAAQVRTKGSWGLFHEFGHNRQRSVWTFEGTEEVTVNIFSLYACQQILGQSPFETTWFKENSLKPAIRYVSQQGLTFRDFWCSDPGVALATYAVLIEHFGWDPFFHVFSEYERLSPETLPTTNSEKILSWVVMTSLAVSMDLRKYYRMWRWPFDFHSSKFLPLDGFTSWEPKLLEVLRSVET
eukprot:Lankesteria_metandrocarpae@DN5274_c0_g1_i1.p1